MFSGQSLNKNLLTVLFQGIYVNIKEAIKQTKIYAGRQTLRIFCFGFCFLFFCFFCHCQVLWRVKPQNNKQIHTTKSFAQFSNHFPQLPMVCARKNCVKRTFKENLHFLFFLVWTISFFGRFRDWFDRSTVDNFLTLVLYNYTFITVVILWLYLYTGMSWSLFLYYLMLGIIKRRHSKTSTLGLKVLFYLNLCRLQMWSVSWYLAPLS